MVLSLKTVILLCCNYIYIASQSTLQSEALPVQETQGREYSLEKAKSGTWLTRFGTVNKEKRVKIWNIGSKVRASEAKDLCLGH